MGYVAKLQKARAKAPTTEKLDSKPLAIIAGTKKPETMSEAIARILDHSLKSEEWERIRGVEYDFSEDEFEDDDGNADTFENGGAEHDDRGYFADQTKGGKQNARNNQSKGKPVDNSDNGGVGDNLGTDQEPALEGSNADEN